MAISLAVGWQLNRAGAFTRAYDSLIYEADCARVIENMTTFTGMQARTRVHPLHVLMTAPLGIPTRAIVRSRELAAVLITAAFAAGTLLNFNCVLQRLTSLGTYERLLLTAALAGSASYATFGAVPETHVLSAFAMSLMVRHLSSERATSTRASTSSFGHWLRSSGLQGLASGAMAIGALVTNVLVIPGYVYLMLPAQRGSVRQRGIQALLVTGALFAFVVVLHLAQRAPAQTIIPATSSDVSGSVESFAVKGDSSTLGSSVKTNLEWVTTPAKLPRKLMQMANATLLTSHFAPRIRPVTKPDRTHLAASFDYSGLALRWPGAAGVLSWCVLFAVSMAAAIRTKAARALLPKPAFLGCIGLATTSFCVFTAYSDELFLFSPNWVFPTTQLFALVYGQVAAAVTPRHRVFMLGLLSLTVAMLVTNSVLHVASLIDLFAAPVHATARPHAGCCMV
jgi:hypothetical protein